MKKNHELMIFENGRISLKDQALGEAMHSWIGPWEEANSIYIEQSDLKSRLDSLRPLVIYDVGLGIAANALAALRCVRSARHQAASGERVRPLHLVSFENDPSGLATALENSDAFPFFKGEEATLCTLLKDGFWNCKEGFGDFWELKVGDFATSVAQGFRSFPAPDLIFYDFYSPKAQPGLWALEYFSALKQISAPDAVLVTYSVATSVRVALLLAGFYVGRGGSTSAKLETTLAARRLEDLRNPLGADWLAKLRRSSRCLPPGFAPAERESVISRIAELPQFK